ncbi:unnamed protein product [Clonostachys rhizophaga]|uniref:Uncharacterized protein n=1 Tax=Clonostachys rhizophaga TaxID=160324 RepID=A0A9N9W0F5_9HYPO|nr:unnamed protein product [Clonostachys rhizophaga]
MATPDSTTREPMRLEYSSKFLFPDKTLHTSPCSLLISISLILFEIINLNMLCKAVILYTLSVAVAASPVLQERDDVTWYRPDPAVYVCKNLNAWDECAKAYSYCSIALNYPQEAW